MAAKKLKKKVQRKPAARKAENPVVDSARDIWLAGLGAFAVAQQEGEKFIKDSNKLFDRLVQEGSKLEKRTRKDVEGAFEDIRGEVEGRVKNLRGEVEGRVKDIRGEVENRVKDIRGEVENRFGDVGKQAEGVRKQASENWNKLESFFEERVSRALNRLGIPSREDIDSLNKRVQQLSRKVAGLEKKARPAAKAKAAPKKPAARKAGVKKAPAKKAAVKKAVVRKTEPVKAQGESPKAA